MAWAKRTATDYQDCLSEIINFACKEFEAGDVTVGSNTGDGIVYGASASEDSVAETFTVTCTTGGSIIVAGTLSPDMTGTYAYTGTNDSKPYFSTGTYALWWSSTDSCWYMGVLADLGTTPVDGYSLSQTSLVGTWVIVGSVNTGEPVTTVSGGGDGVAVFSVSGSVSGTQASATCADPYTTSLVSLILLGGDTDFIVGDSFTFDIAASTALWSVNDSDLVSDQHYAMLKGVGSGTYEVFVGFRTQSNDSTYFNLECTDFSGFVTGNDYDDQPGIQSYYTCLSNVSFDFWIFMTGRSIKIVAVIGTIYEHGYAGWFLPNATPSQYSYPAYVGGSSDDYTQLVGGTEDDHTAYWRAYSDEFSGAVHDGTSWVELNEIIPITEMSFENFFPDVNGSRLIYPLTIFDRSSTTIYGQLEGLYAVTNADSALTPDDILNQGNMGLVVFQDVYRTGPLNVVAIDLIGDY